MRPIVIDQAQQLFQIRLELLKSDPENAKYLKLIDEFISGYDDSCGSAVLGIVYDVPEGLNDSQFTDWAFKNLFDRELYLLPGTWDLQYRGETTLDGFVSNFRLHKRVSLSKFKESLAAEKNQIKPTIDEQQTTPLVDEEETDETTEKEQIDIEASRVNEPSQDLQVSPLVFTLNSISIEQSYQYGLDSSQNKITASSDYRFLIANFTVRNSTDFVIGFSSEQFSVLNNSGKKINAFLYGVGDSIAESGKEISFDTKVNGPDGIQIVSFKGKASPDVSFIEWELSPNKSYEDTIVYLVRVNEQDLTLQLSSSDISAKPLQESQISIIFNSLNAQQSYQYKSGSSQKEITASSDYKVLIAKVTMFNNADCAMKWSSEQLSIWNHCCPTTS